MNVKSNVLFGFIEKSLLMILGYANRVILIKYLGNEYVGLSTLFTSIMQILNFAELGLEGAVLFKLYQPVAVKNYEMTGKYIDFYRRFCLKVGVIVTSLSLILIPFLHIIIKDGIPSDVNIYILYIMYILTAVQGYFSWGYQSVIFNSTGKMDVLSKISCISLLIQNIVQIILLIKTSNYYLYYMIVPATTFLKFLLQRLYVKKKYSDVISRHGNITVIEKNELREKVKSLIGYKINSLVVLSSDSVVISAFMGLSLLGKYNNYYYVITSLNAFVIIILNSIKPFIGQKMATADSVDKYNIFKQLLCIYSIIIVILSACTGGLLQQFVTLSFGPDSLLSSGIPYLMAIYFYIWKMLDFILMYQDTTGIWGENKFLPYVEAGVNLGLNLLLVNIIGLYGIVLSTVISMLIVCFGVTKTVYAKCFNLKIDSNYIMKIILTDLVCMIIAASISCFVKIETWNGFILKGIIMVILIVILNKLIFKNNLNIEELKKMIR